MRSKKAAGWRTMLVIPELESELATLGRCCGNMAELRVLRQQRDALEDQVGLFLKGSGVVIEGE